MIVPDVNLLVYAYNDKALEHTQARFWWENCLNGTEPIGLSWVVVGGFLRLMTHPRILVTPMVVEKATRTVREWLDQPPVQVLQPGQNFQYLFLDYLDQFGVGGNLVTDAHLAALAVEYEAELHSNDSDFARFPGLHWENPLLKADEK